MFPRLAPILLDAAMGVGDGVLRDSDAKHVATRTKMTKQYGFWAEVVAVGAGLFAQMSPMGFLPQSISEPLLSNGTVLLSERLTRNMLGPSASFNAPLPYGISGRQAAVSGIPGYAAPAYLPAARPSMPSTVPAFATKEYSPTIV